MPNTGAIRAGRAFVELFADDSRLVRGLRRASAKLKAFGESVRNMGLKLAALGSAVAAPLLASTKVFSGMGDQLAKMSARTGFSVETLSELGFAAELSGSNMEDLEKSIRRMQATVVDAAQGLSTATDALATLGLKAEDLAGLTPERQFKLVADRLSQIEDPTLRAATAMDIFGRSGTQLLPMLAGGAAGIEQLQEQARRLGLTISTEDAKAAERFTDTMTILWKVLKQATFTIGSALAPVLSEVANWITKVGIQAGSWIKQNRQVIVTVLKVAAAVVAGGIALVALGYAISGLGTVLSVLATIVSGMGTALGILAKVLAFLISPVGMVIAAVAALGAYLLYATGAGAKALSWLGERFDNLRKDALAAFGGISDALAAGDIGLAAKILWLTLKMEWQKGVAILQKAWLNFRNFFIRIAYDAFYGALAALETVWHGLEVAWIETTAFLSKTWTNFTGWVAKAWAWCGNALTKAWNRIKALFDETFDADAANAAADKAYEAGVQRIEQEKDARLAEREARRGREREESRQVHDATMAEIGKESLAKEQALDEEYNARIKATQEAIDKTRKEWQDAIAAARRKRQEKESAAPGAIEPPDDLLNRLRESMANLGELLDRAAKNTVSVAGTFNAAAIQGLQAGGAAERTAKATEQTAKNTQKLVNEVQRGGLKFS